MYHSRKPKSELFNKCQTLRCTTLENLEGIKLARQLLGRVKQTVRDGKEREKEMESIDWSGIHSVWMKINNLEIF